MKPYTLVLSIFVICSLIALSGCQQATNGGSPFGSTSGPVSGTVNGQGFSTAISVATASKTVSDSYDIQLSGSTATPNVYFTVRSSPQTYTVTTFGIKGLAVTAYVGGMDFVSFDSGILTITSVDTGAKQITGTLASVKTTDGNSSLSGGFTATIQ